MSITFMFLEKIYKILKEKKKYGRSGGMFTDQI
jgi:hypothetical protein